MRSSAVGVDRWPLSAKVAVRLVGAKGLSASQGSSAPSMAVTAGARGVKSLSSAGKASARAEPD